MQIGDVLRLVLTRGLILTGLGLGLGLAGALAFTRVLKSFLQDISPTDPWTFAVIACVLAAVSTPGLLSPRPAGGADRPDGGVAM